jgi:hypothetical protein
MQKVWRGLKNPSFWVSMLPIVFFFVVVSLQLVSQNTVAIIANGLDIGGAILLDFAMIPAWWRMLRSERKTPEAFLFGGILLFVNALAASRLWSLAIIMSGKPSWMINHWFQSFCYLLMGIAIFYLLRVPGEQGTMKTKYVAYGLVVAVGVMVLFLLHVEG